MDPITPVTAVIDQVEAVLGHSPHPAVVSIPIGAWTVSNVCDALAVVTGNERFDDAARISMAIGLAGAVGAAITGIRDYRYIDKDAPSHQTATTHAIGNGLAASLMTASFILRQRDHQAGVATSHLARVLGLAGGALTMYTGWLGGVLVQEYGEGVKPVMDQKKQEEEPQGRERLSPASPLGLHHV